MQQTMDETLECGVCGDMTVVMTVGGRDRALCPSCDGMAVFEYEGGPCGECRATTVLVMRCAGAERSVCAECALPVP